MVNSEKTVVSSNHLPFENAPTEEAVLQSALTICAFIASKADASRFNTRDVIEYVHGLYEIMDDSGDLAKLFKKSINTKFLKSLKIIMSNSKVEKTIILMSKKDLKTKSLIHELNKLTGL